MISTNMLYLDLMYLIFIVCAYMPIWVFLVLGWQLFGSWTMASHKKESDTVEFFWTVVPSATVMVLCYFKLNCVSYDMLDIPMRTVKVVGRQWYWTYDVEKEKGEYDSTMSDFVKGVDKPLRLAANKFHYFVITSSDVIHSFSVPEFKMKVDAMPGRINYTIFCPSVLGVYVGYCTELCGAGHAYMPMVLEVVLAEDAPELIGWSRTPKN